MIEANVFEMKRLDIIDATEARILLDVDNMLETSKKPVCPDCKKPMTREFIETGPTLHLSHRFVWICGCTVNYK